MGLAATLARFLSTGAIPECPHCRAMMTAAGEKRLVSFPPVFEITCRCPACGYVVAVRQAFDPFD